MIKHTSKSDFSLLHDLGKKGILKIGKKRFRSMNFWDSSALLPLKIELGLAANREGFKTWKI